MTSIDASAATDAGSTRPAGQGIEDEALAEQVADQTSGDLKVAADFAQEADGVTSDRPAEETFTTPH